jgi:hypothetical protein
MLRADFIQAIDTVVHAVADAGIPVAIHATLRPTNQNTDFKEIFDAQSKFRAHLMRFGDAEIAVLKALDWFQLAESEFWTNMLRNSKLKERNQGLPEQMLTLSNYLPRVAELLKQDDLDEGGGRDLLPIVIGENEPNRGSLSVADLIGILRALNGLYVQISRVYEADGPLVVSALDSGSPLSLLVGGTKIVVVAMKAFIQKNHERIFFFQAAKARAHFRAAGDGVDFLEKLHRLEKNGGISKKEAAAIRRRTEKDVKILLENGVTLPKMIEVETKQIEHHPTKLIAHEKPNDQSDSDTKSGS